jgi:hypothetical protein
MSGARVDPGRPSGEVRDVGAAGKFTVKNRFQGTLDMRNFILLTGLFAGVAVVYPQDSHKTIPTNEYRFMRGTLVCIADSVSATSPFACLHIGAIRIADSYDGIETRYGKPSQVIPQSKGREIKVFELKSKIIETTYLAITVGDNIVYAIQVEGATPDDPLAFSSISLGDSSRRLIELLGEPSKRKSVEESGATLWSYVPFPFSFEIVADKVNSMKIWKP